MICRNCHTIIPDDSLFCENCGEPTGLTPEDIDDSNLIPEEAVEFEVEEGPDTASSVPVDPVWWEPPEDMQHQDTWDESWDDWGEEESAESAAEEASGDVPEEAAEETFEAAAEEGTGAKAGSEVGSVSEAETAAADKAASGTGTEAEPAAEEDHFGADDLKQIAADAAAQAKPYMDKAKAWLGGLGKSVRTGTGWAADAAKEQFHQMKEEYDEKREQRREEREQQREEAAEQERLRREAEAELERQRREEAELERKRLEEEAEIERARLEEEAEQERLRREEEERAERQRLEEEAELERQRLEKEAELEEQRRAEEEELERQRLEAEEIERKRLEEEEERERQRRAEEEEFERKRREEEEEHERRWQEEEAERERQRKEEEKLERQRIQEDMQQREQERLRWEEEREQRELERQRQEAVAREQEVLLREAEARKLALEQQGREDEAAQQELKLQRLEEEARQREEAERKRREQEEREREEDLTQPPGFWYRGNTEAIEEAEHGSKRDPETRFGREHPQEEMAEPDHPDKAEDGAEHPQEESEREHVEGTGSIDELAKAADAAKATEKLPEAEPLPDKVIEDKLADTARFHWSKDELNDTGSGEGSAAASLEESIDAKLEKAVKAAEEADKEEPALYRIKDYADFDRFQNKAPKAKTKENFLQKRWKLIAVILAIVIAIAIIAGVAIHNAHQRQLEEEAYQASVKQAQTLMHQQKYKKAEKRYLKLMEQRPEDTQLYLDLAQMYIDQERYVDAKALIKRAIKLTGDKKAFKEMRAELKVLTSTEWKKEYIKVLEDYEMDIRRYEEDVTASVAVCDVNNDMKPELFFFTKEYYGYGKLHIYTTVNDVAKEVSYECRNRGTQYQDAFYDVSSDDSSYAIFNLKENGMFAIYANIVHGNDSWDTTNEYVLNLQGGCKQQQVIEGSIDTTYSESENDDSEYLMNEEDITYDKYIAEFRRVLGQAQQVILYNGSGGDQSVWTKINPNSVMCMPYDTMMVDLNAE